MKHLNKKKKKSLWAMYSNSTIYFTLIVSLVLHTIVIYSIPAVNVFSEGPDPSSEPIVVDIYQEEASESVSEMAQPDSDQFLAHVPDNIAPLEQPSDMSDTEPKPDRLDLEVPIPEFERQVTSDHDTFLLSQLTERDPDLFLPEKRSVSQTPDHQQPVLPKQQLSEKITMAPPPLPLQVQPPQAIHEYEPIKMRTFSTKPLPQQDQDEPSIQFPLRSPQHEQSPSALSQNVADSPFSFNKPPVKDLAKESSAPALTRSDTMAFSPKRQFGIVKEKESDTNQFGIFAGKKFDEPPMKDAVEEARATVQQLPPQPEETELAQNLPAESQIEGPIRGRAIVRRPQPPQVNVSIEVELRLRFWVLPDGTIGEVIPIKRGDAQLERIAITYLKQWRFEPLAPGVPQEKIWGTIPIRFTVQ